MDRRSVYGAAVFRRVWRPRIGSLDADRE